MHYIFFGITCLILVTALISIPVLAQDANQSTNASTVGGALQSAAESSVQTAPQSALNPGVENTDLKNTTDTKEDKQYQEQALKLSNEILEKISQIQAKQKEIDSEVFPAYVAPLQAEKNRLQDELNALQMRKMQMETQKTAQEMKQQLNQ